MVRRGRALAPVAIVRADRNAVRSATAIAVAALAGIGIALGCASEASARRPARVGDVQVGKASYYGKEFEWRRTASGERYDPNGMTAAHKTLPFGTMVRVTNRRNNQSVVVRINDRGPFVRGRVIDLTPAGARAIGMSGLAPVSLAVMGRS